MERGWKHDANLGPTFKLEDFVEDKLADIRVPMAREEAASRYRQRTAVSV